MSNEAPGPFLMTADEVAALLRTSRAAIYALAARGELPGVTRPGRRFLVRRAVSMPLRQPDSAFTVATPRW